MTSLRTRRGIIVVGIAVAMLACSVALGQQGILVQPAPTGRLQVLRAGQPIMAVELSVHGDNWTHAAQSKAQAQVSRLADEPGILYKGILNVPGGEGPLNYEQAVRPTDNGFFVDYKMWFNQPTNINGLQVSVLLPTARYRGKDVVLVGRGERETTVTLPPQLNAAKWVLYTGPATEVQIAPGTDLASAIAPETSENILIHDLRQWQQDVFEIRFWEVNQNTASAVEANREFTINLAFGFQEPVTIRGMAAP